jgi:hypothetical protein
MVLSQIHDLQIDDYDSLSPGACAQQDAGQ